MYGATAGVRLLSLEAGGRWIGSHFVQAEVKGGMRGKERWEPVARSLLALSAGPSSSVLLPLQPNELGGAIDAQ